MPPDKGKPPARDRRLSKRVLAEGFDALRVTPKTSRKQAYQRRPLGPGERAAARELRKRGLHLKLVEAWRL